MLRRLLLALGLILAVVPCAAHAGWFVNAAGECVEAWTPSRAAQGPVAMLNAFPLPFREAVGGGVVAANTTASPQTAMAARVLSWPGLILGGFAIGGFELPLWVALGLVDTVTLGHFDVVPDDAKPLTLASFRPRFLGKPNVHCGGTS
jgi:hypothetical protein